MKKTILFTCLTALLAACSGKSAVTAPDETTVQPVNLILDTDLGPDYDDVGACIRNTVGCCRKRVYVA